MVLATPQSSNQSNPRAGACDPRSISTPFDRARTPGEEALTPLLVRARQRRAAGDLLGALRDLDAFLAGRPDHAAALVQRAWVLRDLGRVRAAAFDFDRAVALAPHDPDMLHNRARFHQEIGDMSLAAADWLQAQALCHAAGVSHPAGADHGPLPGPLAHPPAPPAPAEPVEALYLRGVIYVEIGNPRAGIAALRQVLDHRPADPDVLYRLAWACARAGDYDDALQWLGAALALRPALVALADQEPAFAPCRLPEV